MHADSGHPTGSMAIADDVLDQSDDAAAEPGVFDEDERLG